MKQLSKKTLHSSQHLQHLKKCQPLFPVVLLDLSILCSVLLLLSLFVLLLEKRRENWAKECNKQLEREGHKERIDHRSYEEQGIKKVPTKHEGHTVRAMEQRGIKTDIGNINRGIKEQETKRLNELMRSYMDVEMDKSASYSLTIILYKYLFLYLILATSPMWLINL